MPYIPTNRRGATPVDAGELNYAITKLVDAYLQQRGVRYEHINTLIGVLECAKLELYRRIAGPYEDKKCQENGDVYGQ
jgi:hypothetical protein